MRKHFGEDLLLRGFLVFCILSLLTIFVLQGWIYMTLSPEELERSKTQAERDLETGEYLIYYDGEIDSGAFNLP